MAIYTLPAISAVDFTETESPYTLPAISAVDFELLEGPQILIPSPLGAPQNYFVMDYADRITKDPGLWIMRISGDPVLEIPISSWQGTTQVDRQTYLQAVVPNVSLYTADLTSRQSNETFEILKVYEIDGGDLYYQPVVRAPLQTITVYRGPFKETATIIGYGDVVANAYDPGVITMQGVRQVTQTIGGNVRFRGDIDIEMQPGNDIIADGLQITAAYVNVFVTTGGDSYMDCGTR